MRTFKIVCFSLLIPLGVSMFIYGGYDDSPGGQLLGLAGVFIGIRNIFNILRKNP
jgi:hypothetical protein